jgi:hypothetical protein
LRGKEFAERWLKREIVVTSYSLPGVLPHFPVTSQDTIDIDPIQAAIEQMTDANEQLADCIADAENGTIANASIQPLQMKLNGMINAAVQGGLDNYKCFFSAEYEQHIENDSVKLAQLDTLSDLIAAQVKLFDLSVKFIMLS